MCHQDQVFGGLSTIIVQAGTNALIMATVHDQENERRRFNHVYGGHGVATSLQGTPEVAGGSVMQKVKSEDVPRAGSIGQISRLVQDIRLV